MILSWLRQYAARSTLCYVAAIFNYNNLCFQLSQELSKPPEQSLIGAHVLVITCLSSLLIEVQLEKAVDC